VLCKAFVCVCMCCVECMSVYEGVSVVYVCACCVECMSMFARIELSTTPLIS